MASDLADVGIVSTTQLLDFFMLGDNAVADFSRTGRLNTDDHPRLEFLAPRSLRASNRSSITSRRFAMHESRSMPI